MSNFPSIHDAYGGFGEKPEADSNQTSINILPSPTKQKLNPKANEEEEMNKD